MTEEQAQYQTGLDLPEAPASATFKTISKSGYHVQFTIRDWSENAMLERTAAFIKRLESGGFVPENGYGHTPKAEVPITTASHDAPSSSELPMLLGSPAPQKAEELSFAADELVGSMDKGKVYWKVKGGKYAKYGVTIWPEALSESGIDPAKLDVSVPYDLRNQKLTAHYVESEGKPQKVTRLVRE